MNFYKAFLSFYILSWIMANWVGIGLSGVKFIFPHDRKSGYCWIRVQFKFRGLRGRARARDLSIFELAGYDAENSDLAPWETKFTELESIFRIIQALLVNLCQMVGTREPRKKCDLFTLGVIPLFELIRSNILPLIVIFWTFSTSLIASSSEQRAYIISLRPWPLSNLGSLEMDILILTDAHT